MLGFTPTLGQSGVATSKDFALLEKKKKKMGDLYGAHLPIGWSI